MLPILLPLGLLISANILLFIWIFFRHKHEISKLTHQFEVERTNAHQKQVSQDQNRTQTQNSELVATQILKEIHFPVFVMSNEGTLLYVNKSCELILAMSNESVLGKRYTDLINFLDENEKSIDVVEVMKNATFIIPPTWLLKTANKKIPIIGSIDKIINGEKAMGFVVSFQDNSTYKNEETEVKAFFSTSVHELRGPLTVIKFQIDQLQDGLSKLPSEKVQEIVGDIKSATEHMLVLVNDFLEFSRIEFGRVKLQKTSFDLVKLVGQEIAGITTMAHAKKLALNHEEAGNSLYNVSADQEKTRQIVINMLSNAIKYTLQGIIQVQYREKDQYVELMVIDAGVGISKEHQALLFKRFAQVGEGRRRQSSEGTGLGLYISKKMANLMGGDIYLESSEPGKGSIFVLKLPRA